MKVYLYNISSYETDYWMKTIVNGQYAEASSVGVKCCVISPFGKSSEFLKKNK